MCCNRIFPVVTWPRLIVPLNVTWFSWFCRLRFPQRPLLQQDFVDQSREDQQFYIEVNILLYTWTSCAMDRIKRKIRESKNLLPEFHHRIHVRHIWQTFLKYRKIGLHCGVCSRNITPETHNHQIHCLVNIFKIKFSKIISSFPALFYK